MKRFCWLVSFAVCLAAGGLCAYTPAETNDVVKGMLFYVVQIGSYDNFTDDRGIVIKGPNPDTWEGFLGGGRDGSWTTAERKAAFDWYLSTLGTTDFTSVRSMDKKLVLAALTRCELFSYTNSAPYLKALALNPKGVHRDIASELFLKFSPVEDDTTDYVEMIMTNVVGYSRIERGTTCGIYSYLLCLSNATNTTDQAVKDRAVEMFYRNRNVGIAAAQVIDMLLVSNVVDYASSMNRFQTITNMLSHTELSRRSRRDFVAVTNQLLSSGLPLRWLNR